MKFEDRPDLERQRAPFRTVLGGRTVRCPPPDRRNGDGHRVQGSLDDDYVTIAPTRCRKRLVQVDRLVVCMGDGRVLVLGPAHVADVPADESANLS